MTTSQLFLSFNNQTVCANKKKLLFINNSKNLFNKKFFINFLIFFLFLKINFNFASSIESNEINSRLSNNHLQWTNGVGLWGKRSLIMPSLNFINDPKVNFFLI